MLTSLLQPLALLLLLSSSNVIADDGSAAAISGGLTFSSDSAGRSQGLSIEPERSTTIAVSNRDINRIHCLSLIHI